MECLSGQISGQTNSNFQCASDETTAEFYVQRTHRKIRAAVQQTIDRASIAGEGFAMNIDC